MQTERYESRCSKAVNRIASWISSLNQSFYENKQIALLTGINYSEHCL